MGLPSLTAPHNRDHEKGEETAGPQRRDELKQREWEFVRHGPSIHPMALRREAKPGDRRKKRGNRCTPAENRALRLEPTLRYTGQIAAEGTLHVSGDGRQGWRKRPGQKAPNRGPAGLSGVAGWYGSLNEKSRLRTGFFVQRIFLRAQNTSRMPN